MASHDPGPGEPSSTEGTLALTERGNGHLLLKVNSGDDSNLEDGRGGYGWGSDPMPLKSLFGSR